MREMKTWQSRPLRGGWPGRQRLLRPVDPNRSCPEETRQGSRRVALTRSRRTSKRVQRVFEVRLSVHRSAVRGTFSTGRTTRSGGEHPQDGDGQIRVGPRCILHRAWAPSLLLPSAVTCEFQECTLPVPRATRRSASLGTKFNIDPCTIAGGQGIPRARGAVRPMCEFDALTGHITWRGRIPWSCSWCLIRCDEASRRHRSRRERLPGAANASRLATAPLAVAAEARIPLPVRPRRRRCPGQRTALRGERQG
mmetsp:Transcript_48290/g.148976  ORF Transcript_48290/g.148976 Transcript_48290/m.148976 type:complete len:252 (-) Transcript_48290:578-1333(-)